MNTNHARKWEYSRPATTPQKKQVKVKVRTTGWITKGEKIIYTFVGACLIASSFYIVSYASTNDALNREIQSLEQKIEDQQIQNELLFFEKQELSKPERIIKIARDNGLKIDTKVKRAQALTNN